MDFKNTQMTQIQNVLSSLQKYGIMLLSMNANGSRGSGKEKEQRFIIKWLPENLGSVKSALHVKKLSQKAETVSAYIHRMPSGRQNASDISDNVGKGNSCVCGRRTNPLGNSIAKNKRSICTIHPHTS